MAYVDGFRHDVFLSYARVDDQAAAGERGWVSAFEEHLRIALDRQAGRIGSVKIWRDVGGIDGNQLFDRTITDALDASAVLVALTSRGYLASDYCRKEVAHFHRQAEEDRHGLAIDDRLRIFNVLLTNVDSESWPSEFERTGGFVLHDAKREDDTGQPSEPGSPAFKQQLRALADALYRLLAEMKEASRPAAGADERAPGTVFLADVADSLRSQVRNLSEDLKRHRIEVVRGVPPPYEAAEHDQRVVEALDRADLSVHLFDGYAGREIDGRGVSTYPRRQLDLAVEHARSRLIWRPGDLDLDTVEDEAHRGFLQGLERGDSAGGAYDFIRGLRADLSGQILEKIELLRAKDDAAEGRDRSSCLLVTHAKDTTHMLPVAGTLTAEGVHAFINQEANEPRAVLELFEDRLREVASLIIFYGAVQKEWVAERLDVAIKLAAMERLDLRLAVFAAPPEKPSRELTFGWGPFQVKTLSDAGDALDFVGAIS